MDEDDDILRATSPFPRSPMEETLYNIPENSLTIFDDPTYTPFPRSPMEETLYNIPEHTKNMFDDPNYDERVNYLSAIIPRDVDKAREMDAWGTEKAAFWAGIQHTAPFNLGRIIESWVGGSIPSRITFGDLPWTDEVEEGMNLSYTHDWLGISESEWDKLSIGERSKLINETVTERIKAKYKPDELSGIYTAIKTASMFLDPTFFMPIAGPASKIGVVKASAAVAVTDSALYEYSTEGEITVPQTTLALALGAGGGKLAKTLLQKAKVREARRDFNFFTTEVIDRYNQWRGNKSSIDIWMDIRKDFNLTDERFDIIMKTARTGKIPKESSLPTSLRSSPTPYDVHPAYMSTGEAKKLGRPTGKGTVRGLGNVTATDNPTLLRRLQELEMKELGNVTATDLKKTPRFEKIEDRTQGASKVHATFMEARAPLEIARRERDRISRIGGEKFYDKYIEPLSAGVARYNPTLLRRLQELELKELKGSQRDLEEVTPFLRQMQPHQGFRRVLSKEHVKEVHYMMAGAPDKPRPGAAIVEIEKFIMANAKSVERGKAMVKNYRSYRRVMNRTHHMRNAARRGAQQKALPRLRAYTPIRVKDVEYVQDLHKLDQSENKIFQEMLDKRANLLELSVDDLTAMDRADVLDRFLAGKDNPAAGSAKHRAFFNRTREDFEKGYMNIVASTNKYIKESHQEIHRHNLFGKYLNEEDMGDTILKFTAGKMSTNQSQIQNLLKHRYIWGPRSTHKALQAIKNTGYLTLLAHPVNAARQLGDLALGAYENGLINTVNGLYDSILRRGLTAKEMAMVTNKAHELTESTFGRKTLDWGMTWSGFSEVDALGKGALMNGTIRRISKEVRSIKGVEAIRTKWGAAFGEDTSKLIDDFRKFNRGEKFHNKYTGETDDFSPLMKELAFAQVSKFQPISMLEMPKMWLKAPNGRFLYMLQSFTLKHLNIWRKDVTKELFTKRGNKIKGAQAALRLASFFTLGNIGVDKINDLMLGKDRDLEQLFILNLYRNIGLINKYDMDRFGSGGYGIGGGGFVGNVMTTFGPPLDPLIDGVGTAMGIAVNMGAGRHWSENQKWDQFSNIVPIIGKIVGAWGYKAGLPATKEHALPTKQQYDKAHSYLPKVLHGIGEDIHDVLDNQWNNLSR